MRACASKMRRERSQNGQLKVAASAGKGPQVGATLSGARAALINRSRAGAGLVTGLVKDAGGWRLVLAASGRSFVAFEESPVDPTQAIPDSPGNPYSDLEVALYASRRADQTCAKSWPYWSCSARPASESIGQKRSA